MKNMEKFCDKIAKNVSGNRKKNFINYSDLYDDLDYTESKSHIFTSQTVFHSDGQRKYLTNSEINAFILSAKSMDAQTYAFCLMLSMTGCRISEALSLTSASIDFESKNVNILSLKKRGKVIFRSVPLPLWMLKEFRNWLASGVLMHDRLWPWSRMTAYRRVLEVMQSAGIRGRYATPRGLRHGFGVRAIQAKIPLTLVQRWLGHADIKTTAIYTAAMGEEERLIASQMWETRQRKSKPI